ncbi:hypothetical protein NEUTE1DRAFT_111482 [Neurospora tetrasperma FGSC 2508]|uniref:Uncharacterized protein n=1 Tax=Neurospora tetrasperma (strain FGSC 2508 / ATCC MYA-4615 / P0657) TaxID=510951 RepID=F8MPH0_NEUT8|nr:uncharacterized protein NEUTE1DRAFT_111482 [Neurospora tetrasperma FGSC 2508]EGO57129.1 hypothetical protein NEUTE1DRAFT_111482 [Neurospora tetrasperma FGSC 2508]
MAFPKGRTKSIEYPSSANPPGTQQTQLFSLHRTRGSFCPEYQSSVVPSFARLTRKVSSFAERRFTIGLGVVNWTYQMRWSVRGSLSPKYLYVYLPKQSSELGLFSSCDAHYLTTYLVWNPSPVNLIGPLGPISSFLAVFELKPLENDDDRLDETRL